MILQIKLMKLKSEINDYNLDRKKMIDLNLIN